MNILGSLMKNPLLLAQIDRYKIEPNDFVEKIHKIVFSTIYNIYTNGAKSISVIDIDNYLKGYPDLYSIFNNQNGIQYLLDCIEISDENVFDFYYNKFKKLSALRMLVISGFDISEIYCANILDKNYNKIQENFEIMSIEDIFNIIKKNFYNIEEKYVTSSVSGSANANHKILELKESLKIHPEIGLPLQGVIFNSICRGARKGKYYIRSAPSGAGKSRLMVGDACNLAYPIMYDVGLRKWIEKDYFEKCLYITTELDKEEIQTMILARISGVNEDKILYGSYNGEEEARVYRAIEIMDMYPNLELEHIPDPSIGQIEAVVRKQVLVNKIENVFYDYIFSSPSLLNEFASLRIREDVVLAMLSTSLKDLAVELGIFMETSTQLSGEVENKKGIRNQNFLRGSKAVADKIDFGCILMPLGQEELSIISSIAQRLNKPIPNYVTDIYKARRSKYKNVKIWSYIDLGTCTIEDVMITDAYYNPIDNFEIIMDIKLNKVAEGKVLENREEIKIIEEEREIKEDLPSPIKIEKKKLSLKDF